MSDTSNFAKYARLIKKCRKTFNIIPLIYAVLSLLFLIVAFLMMITINYTALFTFLDALIFSPTICYLGFRGSYHRQDLAAAAVPVISFLNILVLKYGAKHIVDWGAYGSVSMNVPAYVFYIGVFILIVSVFLAFINLRANNTYRFLETQVGFPYFNERAEQQRLDKISRDIKDPYQREYEIRMRTATSDMENLDFSEINLPVTE